MRETAADRPATGSTTRSRAVVVGVVVGLTGVLVRLHDTHGIDVAPVPLCPVHAVTGLWCPLCGSLRAVAALTHLDVAGALSANLLVTLLMPLLAAGVVLPLVGAATGRAVPRVTVGNRTWLVLGVAFAVFTVWRNLPGIPLSGYLAP